MGSGVLAVGDELWMYYSGFDQLHDQGEVAELPFGHRAGADPARRVRFTRCAR